MYFQILYFIYLWSESVHTDTRAYHPLLLSSIRSRALARPASCSGQRPHVRRHGSLKALMRTRVGKPVLSHFSYRIGLPEHQPYTRQSGLANESFRGALASRREDSMANFFHIARFILTLVLLLPVFSNAKHAYIRSHILYNLTFTLAPARLKV